MKPSNALPFLGFALCLALTGCKGSIFGGDEDVTVEVPSVAEAQAQAEEQINDQNLEDQLEQMEAELADAEADAKG